jgi:probable F420-dependent oxidoreductase
LGAGHAEEEFRAAGLPYPAAGERVERVAETAGTLRRLLGTDDAGSVTTAQDRVPIMIGGNGDRLLQIAAAQADIVGLVGFRSGTGQVHSDLSHFRWDGLADRVALVRRHAGERADDLELSVLVQAVKVTDQRAEDAARIADAFEQPLALVLDSPFLMVGSADELADQVRRLRDDLGVTYVTAFEPAGGDLAQIIERLR